MKKDPFDLIAAYFGGSGSGAKAEQIAPPPALQAIGKALPQLIVVLGVLGLTAQQRKTMSGKGSAGQRERSEAMLGLLLRNGSFADRVPIDPAVFRQVIDKDESYDIFSYTLGLTRQCVGDAQLLLLGWMSDRVGRVVDYVRNALAGRPDIVGDRGRLCVRVGGVDTAAIEEDLKARERKQRLARKARPQQKELAQQQDQLAQLPEQALDLRRFLADAMKGMDLGGKQQLAPKHKTGKHLKGA